jgi:hypothetical protein
MTNPTLNIHDSNPTLNIHDSNPILNIHDSNLTLNIHDSNPIFYGTLMGIKYFFFSVITGSLPTTLDFYNGYPGGCKNGTSL